MKSYLITVYVLMTALFAVMLDAYVPLSHAFATYLTGWGLALLPVIKWGDK